MICEVLAINDRSIIPHYRVLGNRGKDAKKYNFHSSFAVEIETDIQAILHLFDNQPYWHLPKFKNVQLYIPHLSSQEDIASDAWLHGRGPLLALDVRGMGQTTALTCADENFFAPYGNDYLYASYANMLGKPYLGQRVYDLISVLNLLQHEGFREVHLMGRGLGALTATFAACLHPLVKRVALNNALLSYSELTQVPVQSWPLSSMAYGILRYFDLPDCYRALTAKHLAFISPWNSQMQAWNKKEIKFHARSLGVNLKLIDKSR